MLNAMTGALAPFSYLVFYSTGPKCHIDTRVNLKLSIPGEESTVDVAEVVVDGPAATVPPGFNIIKLFLRH